jgi:3-carboxy-cis,cis-muconate cycloisomerase
MSANLDLTGGLVMAESLTMTLAPHVGRPEAYRIVQALCTQVVEKGENLRQIALKNAQVGAILSHQEIERALDPAAYLGSTDAFVQRTLATYRTIQSP